MIIDSKPKSTVLVVDDDQAIRHAMELLMKSIGLACEIYDLADDFLTAHSDEKSDCLVPDIRMPRIGDAPKTDRERRTEQQEHAEVRTRIDKRTKCEREVLDLVVTGKPNQSDYMQTQCQLTHCRYSSHQRDGENARAVTGDPGLHAHGRLSLPRPLARPKCRPESETSQV